MRALPTKIIPAIPLKYLVDLQRIGIHYNLIYQFGTYLDEKGLLTAQFITDIYYVYNYTSNLMHGMAG